MATIKLSAYQRTLNTADTLFYTRGINAVGVDLIVAEANIAKSTLYQHFGSKAGLVTAYLQKRTEQSRNAFTHALSGDGGVEDRLQNMFALIVRACAHRDFRGCPFINFATEVPDRSHPAWKVCLDHRDWVLSIFESMGRAEGLQKPGEFAEHLLMQYDAIMVGAVFAPEMPASDRAFQSVMRFIDTSR